LPFSLAELIDIALKNNPQTRITWAQARSAAANYAQTQSQDFPQLTGSFEFERFRTPQFVSSLGRSGMTPAALAASGAGTTTAGTAGSAAGTAAGAAVKETITVQDFYYSQWGPQLSISYLIFDFGQLRATTEAARYALYYADWTHNYSILELLQDVTNNYYSYLYQEELLYAYEEDIVTAQLTLDATELGRLTGVNDVSDTLQATTQLLQNQTQWASQQQNVQASLATLLTSMGLSANNQLNLEGLPPKIPTDNPLPDVESLIALGLQNRPDLLAAEATVRSNQQNLILAQRQSLPTLQSTFDIAKNYYNNGRLHDHYNFTGTLNLSMPIFAGFYYRNGVKIAKANLKASEETLHESQLSVIQQITTYYSSVKVSFETLQFATAFLEAAEEQYIVALAQYKQGTGTILDVVSAQSSLATARADQANAKQNWYSSLANLAYATGLLSIPALPNQVKEETPPSQEVP
jgi:outer membrane protein TolC